MVSVSAITQKDPKNTETDEIESSNVLKPQGTYTKFIDSLCPFIRPPLKLNSLMIEIINNAHLETSRRQKPEILEA